MTDHNFLTLGVDDLQRALAFYRDGLGWATEGHHRHRVPRRGDGRGRGHRHTKEKLY